MKRLRADSVANGAGLPARSVKKWASAAPSTCRRPAPGFAPRRGYSYAATEGFYGMRNSYYRWKRARAARKFQVYMGKQGREVHFDKEGRYVDPDDRRRMH